MLARRGSQILAFTRRDAVRLVLLASLLVAGLTFVLAFEDLTTMTLISDLVVLAGWFLSSPSPAINAGSGTTSRPRSPASGSSARSAGYG